VVRDGDERHGPFPTERELAEGRRERLFQERAGMLYHDRWSALLRHPSVTSYPQQLSRLRSISGLGGGRFVMTRPRSSVDRGYYSPQDFRFASRLHLGLPIPEFSALGTCDCGERLSALSPEHVLRCRHTSPAGPVCTQVHDRVARVVEGIVRESGVATGGSVVREDSAFFQHTPRPASQPVQPRPDLTFRPAPTSSLPPGVVCLDITVVGTRTSASAAASGKHRHYASWVAQRPSTTFFPLAVDIFGCLGAEFCDFLRTCAHSHAAALQAGTEMEGVMASLEVDYRSRVLWALHTAQAQHVRRRLAWRDASASAAAGLHAHTTVSHRAAQSAEPTTLELVAAHREPEV
jgi:hypothetical protein